jgi:hypothetical protein
MKQERRPTRRRRRANRGRLNATVETVEKLAVREAVEKMWLIECPTIDDLTSVRRFDPPERVKLEFFDSLVRAESETRQAIPRDLRPKVECGSMAAS